MTRPAENFESSWRTTRTHTPTDMLAVYRELFFAGFPGASINDATGAPLFVPEAVVRPMFSHFGAIDTFSFDERRGIGRVTFADGDAAEQCYLTLQYTSLDALLVRTGSSRRLPDTQLLFIEFAEYLPFVNTWLLQGELLRGGGGMSRQLMRTFPRRRDFDCKSGTREAPLTSLLRVAPEHEAHLAAALLGTSPSALANTFFSLQLPMSVNRGLPLSQQSDAPSPLRPTSYVSTMDLWHAHYTLFAAGSPVVDVASLFQSVKRSCRDGELCIIDPLEMPTPSLNGDELYTALDDAVSTRRSGAVEKRVNVRRLLAAAGKAAFMDTSNSRHDTPQSVLAQIEGVGETLQWVMSFLSIKVHAAHEPGRSSVLAAFAGLYNDAPVAPADGAAVEALWRSDPVTAVVRSAMPSAQRAAGLFKDNNLPKLALVAMYRSGSLNSLANTIRHIDAHASSGSVDALHSICADLTVAEVQQRAAAAKKSFRKLRVAASVMWLVLRVPFMILAVIATIALLVALLLGTR